MSETGISSSRRAGDVAGGFTLLEIVVVVAIIAVLAVVVQLSLPDRSATLLALEASRFVQTLHECRDTAVLSGAPAGIHILPSRYELQRYRSGWQPLAGAADARERQLSVAVYLSIGPGSWPSAGVTPQVVCLPTGEVALPGIWLSHAKRAGFYEFRDGPDGEFKAAWVEPPA